jgi:glutathione-specific gamma-glutamylcyclotransferase
MSDFWVFGYGSLIWRPGFEFVEERKAILYGKSRSLCVHSWVHRGTREAPGLVFGLDRGGSCHGMARLVSASKSEPVIAYLRERELVTNVYLEKWVRVKLDDGRQVWALAYVVDRAHEQYASGLTKSERTSRILSAEGVSGKNIDYVANTVKSLHDLGIRDKKLERLLRNARKHA